MVTKLSREIRVTSLLEVSRLVGSVTNRVKVPFYGDHDRNRIILVQLPHSSRHFCILLYKALYDDYLFLVASNKQ